MPRKLPNFRRSPADFSAGRSADPEVDPEVDEGRSGLPLDVTEGSPGSTPPPPAPGLDEAVLTGGSPFDAVLRRELQDPSVDPAEVPANTGSRSVPSAVTPPFAMATPGREDHRPEPGSRVDDVVVESPMERELLLAELAKPVDLTATPMNPANNRAMNPPNNRAMNPPNNRAMNPPLNRAVNRADHTVGSAEEQRVEDMFAPPAGPSESAGPSGSGAPSATVSPSRPSPFGELRFWDRYDEAVASAELYAVPTAAVTVIIGALPVTAPVVERCRASHWVSDCEVYALTTRPELVDDPTWNILRRPSDVVALVEDGMADFPLLVVDIPRDLPAWIRPLTNRLRASGVGLVRYVLDDDPSDEDLATWLDELGRPAVLDLASPVAPARVLELLDRGEPVASVGGQPISADLLVALRLAI